MSKQKRGKKEPKKKILNPIIDESDEEFQEEFKEDDTDDEYVKEQEQEVFESESSDSSDNEEDDIPIPKADEIYVLQKIDEKLSNETVKLLNVFVKDMKISKSIEKGLREYALNSNNILATAIYYSKRNDILGNMDPKSDIKNVNFVNRIKKKELKINGKSMTSFDQIAYMSPQELFPEKWEYEINRKKTREEREQDRPTTDAYPCRKCGARKAIVSIPKQLRSADEPMTTFVTCANCSNVIRI